MKKLNTAELFCGTKSASKVFAKHGHNTLTVDNMAHFEPDLCIDIRDAIESAYNVDLLWASPPCQGFSVMNIGRNWNHDGTPKTDTARLAMELVKKTMRIIESSRPTWWFIENPCDKLRSLPFMDEFLKKHDGVRHTIWYCHYGDDRAKPTDIWTNAKWLVPRPPCHNRRADHPQDCCCHDHEAAPRGSKTGTQGRSGSITRGGDSGTIIRRYSVAI